MNEQIAVGDMGGGACPSRRAGFGATKSLSLTIRVLFEAPCPDLGLLPRPNRLRAVERRERKPNCARRFAVRSPGVSSFQFSRNDQQLRGYNKCLKLFGEPMLWVVLLRQTAAAIASLFLSPTMRSCI